MSLMLKLVRKLKGAFTEKPEVVADDFEFEHFLVYHGLIGTSPPDSRNFKDVRADIKLAASSRSPSQMAIALKVPPLYWEDKLKSVFLELEGELGKEGLIELLAPTSEAGASVSESTPLFNPDWRARANAAILLAAFNCAGAIDALTASLADTASNTMLSFPHQAFALGRLAGESEQCRPKAREALEKYLFDSNSWIRVDAAGALAQINPDEPGDTLLDAVLAPHILADYTAVAVARRVDSSRLLEGGEKEQAAACAIISGVIHAASATFPNEIVFETGVGECLPSLVRLLKERQDSIRIRAALALKDWIETADNREYLDHDPAEELIYLAKLAETDEISGVIEKALAGVENVDGHLSQNMIRSAIVLAGRLKDTPSAARLTAMLEPDHHLLGEALDALAQIEHPEASDRLLKLAAHLADPEERGSREPSKHPVQDENGETGKLYWQTLRTMGMAPTREVQEFLLTASRDYSADKRQEALRSLVRVSEALDTRNGNSPVELILDRIEDCLSDKAPEIRIEALKGLASLGSLRDPEKILKLTEAKEVSVSRQALETLSELARKGHKKRVVQAVEQRLAGRLDAYQKERLNGLIAKISMII
ncbi:MAG: HEAT repeat domain-containing protein [Candidatus Obscuribacterales bacterium]